MHGIGPFRRNLEEKLELARWAAAELRTIPDVEILAEPQLSIVAFRIRRRGLDEDAANALNRRFLQAINARERVYLTGTMLGPRFALRICVLSFRTHADRMRDAMADIREAAAEVVEDL